jgi:hypothetical protein
MILEKVFNLRNICKNRIINIMIIIIMVTIFCNNFIGCGTKNNKLNNSTMNEVVEEIEKSQIGLFTKIAYASKDKVILYGPIGLIVYDIQNQKICRAINLKSIHMNLIQGDDITIFKVKEDGSQILMYNELMYNKSSTKDRYLYDIETDVLEKTNIKEFTNEYDEMTKFNEINPYNDEQLKKYKDMECIDYINVNKSSICYLIHPSEDTDLKGISHLKILIINKETNEEEIYTISVY